MEDVPFGWKDSWMGGKYTKEAIVSFSKFPISYKALKIIVKDQKSLGSETKFNVQHVDEYEDLLNSNAQSTMKVFIVRVTIIQLASSNR